MTATKATRIRAMLQLGFHITIKNQCSQELWKMYDMLQTNKYSKACNLAERNITHLREMKMNLHIDHVIHLNAIATFIQNITHLL